MADLKIFSPDESDPRPHIPEAYRSAGLDLDDKLSLPFRPETHITLTYLSSETALEVERLIREFVEEVSDKGDESSENAVASIRLTMAMFLQWVIKKRQNDPRPGGPAA